jgi:hypothetical protein
MLTKESYRWKVLLLILISTLVRGFLAASLELGNDEVYYRLYALYPDWSHFDHPLMVGVVIQFFTANMLFQSEFFLRLGSIVFGAINIWIMFQIGSMIKNERTGFYASVLYVASIYTTVLAGIFILPDTPQSLFWLLSIYLMLKTLPKGHLKKINPHMLLLGFTLGLGILSKYTTVYLWAGVVLYILLFRRDWFKNASLYLALFITLICVSPILIWNFQNEFISFTFHSGRVDLEGYGLNFNTFFAEFFGEFLYNNPINFLLVLFVIVPVFKDRLQVKASIQAIIVLSSLPPIISFFIFSLFRETLPHWSAPAYTTMLILVAVWIDQMKNRKTVKKLLVTSVSLTGFVLILGYFQINYGLFNLAGTEDPNRLGKNDFSLDMYGYRQTGQGFAKLVDRDFNSGEMPENSVLFGDNWFPLANYDYYAAYPIGLKVFGLSDLNHLHKYAWINKEEGGLQEGMSGYYITDSKYFRYPNEFMRDHFETIETADTIPIYRSGKLVKNAYVYRLKNMIKVPNDPFESP